RSANRASGSGSASTLVASEARTWPPFPSFGDPSGAEHRPAEVALLLRDHLARVHPDAYAKAAVTRQAVVERQGEGPGSGGGAERQHERVPGPLHLDAVVLFQDRANELVMAAEHRPGLRI